MSVVFRFWPQEMVLVSIEIKFRFWKETLFIDPTNQTCPSWLAKFSTRILACLVFVSVSWVVPNIILLLFLSTTRPPYVEECPRTKGSSISPSGLLVVS